MGSGWLWGRRAGTEGARPGRDLAGPLGRRRGDSAVPCAPLCVRLWLGVRCITPFIALRLAASPFTPGYQSRADVMLLIASPENQPNKAGQRAEGGGRGQRGGGESGGGVGGGLVMQARGGAGLGAFSRPGAPGHTRSPALSPYQDRSRPGWPPDVRTHCCVFEA